MTWCSFRQCIATEWLACAVRADLAHEVSKREALMLNTLAPWNHVCYSFNLPLSLVGALTLDDALMQIYGLVSWLPEPKRTKLETALRSHPRCDLCVCSTCNPCRGARVLMVTVVGLGTSELPDCSAVQVTMTRGFKVLDMFTTCGVPAHLHNNWYIIDPHTNEILGPHARLPLTDFDQHAIGFSFCLPTF